jgi:hypothetical protein
MDFVNDDGERGKCSCSFILPQPARYPSGGLKYRIESLSTAFFEIDHKFAIETVSGLFKAENLDRIQKTKRVAF